MAMMMRTLEEEDHHDHHHDHHGNQHREFSSLQRGGGGGGGGLVGPAAISTDNNNNALYDVALHHSTATSLSHTTAFRIPDSQMGFPFTSAQWRELERQAMIYKYMMASLPVPIDLLLPNLVSASSAAATASKLCASAPNLRFANGKGDLEPGRCKRTDGKKWRCSRDVAPNQKYCERHMNRGRPRSRKHVEQQQQQQRQRFQTLTDDNTNNKKIRHSQTKDALLGHDVTAQAHFHGGSSAPVPNYHVYPYGSRSSEWMMKEEQQQAVSMAASSDLRWLPQNLNDEKEEEPFLNLNSYGSHSQERDCGLFLYHGDDGAVSDPPARSFIDAWSQPAPKTETTRVLQSDNATLSPSSLTLSMGNRVSAETDFDETVRVCNPSCWVSPLAEVLRPSAASEPPSPVTGISPAETMTVSSPSGVLQKTAMASLSDSSNCSSPGLASAAMARPEIALL